MSGERNGKISKGHRHASRCGTPSLKSLVMICRERLIELH